jgi:hypothetical protein
LKGIDVIVIELLLYSLIIFVLGVNKRRVSWLTKGIIYRLRRTLTFSHLVNLPSSKTTKPQQRNHELTTHLRLVFAVVFSCNITRLPQTTLATLLWWIDRSVHLQDFLPHFVEFLPAYQLVSFVTTLLSKWEVTHNLDFPLDFFSNLKYHRSCKLLLYYFIILLFITALFILQITPKG